ncbi:hypothetical protein IW261DRAFT_629371 [Armillaria novae-zelandiae]|uniref:Uncharacterized protein n=1 Tax=Armillaria novae-zelandiae TaxID=153914 RepID=A0AA39PPG9_9AGAR|nr:hypothetical protein IW261DRAFT_629371 [Armillaria novae-zelandiae]
MRLETRGRDAWIRMQGMARLVWRSVHVAREIRRNQESQVATHIRFHRCRMLAPSGRFRTGTLRKICTHRLERKVHVLPLFPQYRLRDGEQGKHRLMWRRRKVGLTEWGIKEKRGTHIKWNECTKKKAESRFGLGKDVIQRGPIAGLCSVLCGGRCRRKEKEQDFSSDTGMVLLGGCHRHCYLIGCYPWPHCQATRSSVTSPFVILCVAPARFVALSDITEQAMMQCHNSRQFVITNIPFGGEMKSMFCAEDCKCVHGGPA